MSGGGGDVGREQYCSMSVVDGRNLESQHGDFGVGRTTQWKQWLFAGLSTALARTLVRVQLQG